MEKKDWKLKKTLIWNHIILGAMNKDEEVLIKASNDLDNLISQELDRAREEGRREYARELLDDYYQPDSDSIEIDVSEIQSELSKLTTK